MAIYRISGPWTGQLAIISRPRGGDWLKDEIRGWKSEELTGVISLLTRDEENEFDLRGESGAAIEQQLRFFSLPIPDMSVPASAEEIFPELQKIESLLEAGENIGIHCRQGIGRSALIAACLLVMSGMSPQLAFASISKARCVNVPETHEQRKWVEDFALKFSPQVTRSN